MQLQEENLFVSEPPVQENSYVILNNNNNNIETAMTISALDNTTINNKIIENQTEIMNNQHKIMQQLAKLETMIDIIYVARKNEKSSSCSCETKNTEQIDTDIMEPINVLEDLIKLEEQLSDTRVADNLVKKFSYICGRKGGGSGIDNCYILVDRIFTRKFMTLCSWAGGAKDGNEKIPFKIYKNTIQMFFRVIQLSDKDFTLQKCEEFLKNVIRNSKRRNESNMVRCSKSKKRPSHLIYRIKEVQQKEAEIGGEQQLGQSNEEENST